VLTRCDTTMPVHMCSRKSGVFALHVWPFARSFEGRTRDSPCAASHEPARFRNAWRARACSMGRAKVAVYFLPTVHFSYTRLAVLTKILHLVARFVRKVWYDTTAPWHESC